MSHREPEAVAELLIPPVYTGRSITHLSGLGARRAPFHRLRTNRAP